MKGKPTKKKPAAKAVRKRAASQTKKAVKSKPKPATHATKAKPASRSAATVRAVATKVSKPVGAPPKPAPKPLKKVVGAATVASRRKQFHDQREHLLRKQADLMQAYSISKGDSQSHLDNGTEDYIDYAVNSYAREFLLSLTEMDRKQLLMVEEALRRIDRGEYGTCQQCGEAIAPKRLEVAPWVRHCVRCQELEEKGLLPQSAFALPEGEEAGEEDEAEEEDLRDEEAAPQADDEEEEDSAEEADLEGVAGELDDDAHDDEEETED